MDHARKLRKDTISSGAEDLAVVTFDQVINDRAVLRQQSQRPLLIFVHQTGIALDIRRQYCSKLSLKWRCFHRVEPLILTVLLSGEERKQDFALFPQETDEPIGRSAFFVSDNVGVTQHHSLNGDILDGRIGLADR